MREKSKKTSVWQRHTEVLCHLRFYSGKKENAHVINGTKSSAGRRLAVLIFVMPSRLRLMARIITEPQQESSAIAASDRTGASTCASRTIAP